MKNNIFYTSYVVLSSRPVAYTTRYINNNNVPRNSIKHQKQKQQKPWQHGTHERNDSTQKTE